MNRHPERPPLGFNFHDELPPTGRFVGTKHYELLHRYVHQCESGYDELPLANMSPESCR